MPSCDRENKRNAQENTTGHRTCLEGLISLKREIYAAQLTWLSLYVLQFTSTTADHTQMFKLLRISVHKWRHLHST